MLKYKRILFGILISILIISQVDGVYAKEENQAEILQDIGMFSGTDVGFELDRVSTRAEAAVMLVRLLGAEEIINQEQVIHPFKDVPQWASPYVGYLYEHGLVKGISEDAYGSDALISPNEYVTFLLRALGYSDTLGDFDWQKALTFGVEIGLLSEEKALVYDASQNEGLIRGDMVEIAYSSLGTQMKESQLSLFDALYESGAITPEKYHQYDHLFSKYEMRAVWISYLDLQPLFKEGGESEFRESIASMFYNIKASGLNTAVVQVRPFGDAIYPSNYFPWSYIITGTEGQAPSYDPLEIIIEEGHQLGIKVEAWLNPYRIRSGGSTVAISDDNPAKLWLENNNTNVIQISEGIFYNPASEEVRNLIIKGVLEIVNNYDVDGIHFDDYFYPSASLEYDEADYHLYIAEGGELSQEDWRRENVNKLIYSVYQGIKEIDPNVQLGISPRNDIQMNYDELYIDISKWVTEEGYIDYIAPQLYFGFEHSKYPFAEEVALWDTYLKDTHVKLYLGLAAYKLGKEDLWAGEGKEEWINNKEILKEMVLTGREATRYKGFMLFRYNSIWQGDSGYVILIEEALDALKGILLY